MTKMRINIKKHLRTLEQNDSHRTKTLEAKYEKNICKLENDLREKLSVSAITKLLTLCV